MVVALAAVLQGLDVLRFLSWAVPIAVIISWFTALFQLRTRAAEIHVSRGTGAVRSVWDVLTTQPAPKRHPVLDLRVSRDDLTIGLGDTACRLTRSEWPQFEDMVVALRMAREHQRTETYSVF
jgi:hypothetical protein